VVASDVTTDQNWVEFRDVAVEHGLRSCWSTPILAAEGGEVLGTFAVYKATVWIPDRPRSDSSNGSPTSRRSRSSTIACSAPSPRASHASEAPSRGTAGMALVRLDGTLLKINPAMSAMLGRPDALRPRICSTSSIRRTVG
jgi:hypothetical protein